MYLKTALWGILNGFYRLSPPAIGYSHCLMIVCMFSGWTKCYSIRCANATSGVKKLITEIISWLGIPLQIESDQGTHFTAKINHLFAKPLRYSIKFHTPYQISLNIGTSGT